MSKHDEHSGGLSNRPGEPGSVASGEEESAVPGGPFPAEEPRPHASESAERQAALKRGRERRAHPECDDAAATRLSQWAVNPAFAALAENVRDYAIFLLDPHGVITFWGEGAHLMKWWTREEAEGAHLRLLYPEGGAEDGTAEAHLRDSERTGESHGEGSRVRRDGSTFWADITLTALRNPEGVLMGFAKTTRDLSARRAAAAAVEMAQAAHSARDRAVETAREAEAAMQRAEEAAEFAREQARGEREYLAQVLQRELDEDRARSAALREELGAGGETSAS
ncbi:MAG TPA: PAS domain-containing protein [Longimicrobium sp.]|jgi:PAS domain S-box-containing protein|uniref:PAS domain-containing protein n=1 Tax=Longimicrobium sp. TaxID=2029185 RepID=UPI002ED85D9E